MDRAKADVKQVGIKAYSLMVLKKHDLFDENLFVSTKLLPKQQFISKMKDSGFKEGRRMFVRFSHPQTSVKLPKQVFSRFDPLYKFINDNYQNELTIIVHDFILGKYGGTVTRVGDELVMEFIEGGWNADYSINVDTAIFKQGNSAWYIYQGRRRVPFVDNEQIKLREVKPLNKSKIQKIYNNFSPKINKIDQLLKHEFNSLEFLIDYDLKFKPIELQKIKIAPLRMSSGQGFNETFELKTPHDFKRWDKTTPLLISIPADVDRADELMKVIKEIKNHTSHVYISYGILSHPAILLREAGLTVERKTSNYSLIEITDPDPTS